MSIVKNWVVNDPTGSTLNFNQPVRTSRLPICLTVRFPRSNRRAGLKVPNQDRRHRRITRWPNGCLASVCAWSPTRNTGAPASRFRLRACDTVSATTEAASAALESGVGSYLIYGAGSRNAVRLRDGVFNLVQGRRRWCRCSRTAQHHARSVPQTRIPPRLF